MHRLWTGRLRRLPALKFAIFISLALSWAWLAVNDRSGAALAGGNWSTGVRSDSRQGATIPRTDQVFLPLVPKNWAALPPVDWDPRLGPGGLPLLENVRIIPATVDSGSRFWRVVKARFEDYYESGNDHTIYVKVTDEKGSRVDGQKAHFIGVNSGLSEYPGEKPAGDLCDCNFAYPMYPDDVYNVWIENGYPSDTMAGMLMPVHRHVNYRITFQLTINP